MASNSTEPAPVLFRPASTQLDRAVLFSFPSYEGNSGLSKGFGAPEPSFGSGGPILKFSTRFSWHACPIVSEDRVSKC
jgi:hypothetical protein